MAGVTFDGTDATDVGTVRRRTHGRWGHATCDPKGGEAGRVGRNEGHDLWSGDRNLSTVAEERAEC
jgi:hypothetical protein